MTWRVEWATRARKQADALPPQLAGRIFTAVGKLAADPRPPRCTKLAGSDELWRIRVGDYRIVYAIEDGRLLVLVLRVAHRRDVYR